MKPGVKKRVTTAPGVEIDVHAVGDPTNPAVVLLHGFPELAHSWRHQIGPLVDAGYFVIVPDQRGYGQSSAPAEIHAYSAEHLTGDVVALLDEFGVDQATIVGHDWGAIVAWHMGYFHPNRCRAIVGVSVPFTDWPAPPTDVFRFLHGDNFFYILYFQQPGVAETELDADPARFLRATMWAGSGQMPDDLASDAVASFSAALPAATTTVTEAFEAPLGGPRQDLPPWLTDAEFATYVDRFTASGFFGPVSWYRNFDRNYAVTQSMPANTLSMPTAFIAGRKDPVIAERIELVTNQATLLPDFRGATLLDGVGHWAQQEQPEVFTAALLATLDSVDASSPRA